MAVATVINERKNACPDQPAKTRVVIIDDHPIVVRGISELLEGATAFTVAGSALNVREAVAIVAELQPDMAILDLRLGQDLAPDVMSLLKEAAPNIKIVILTAYDDGALLQGCLARGAGAVLLKDASGLDLIAALDEVLNGGQVVDKRLTSRGHRQIEQDLYEQGGFERLSDREHDILRLLARGLNTREMATELTLMPNTVRSYTQAVLGKLQSKNRVMALATARRLRLV